MLALVPIAIHWPELTGWLSSDPLPLTSGLGAGWQGNGVLSGLPGWIDGNAGVTLQALGHLAAHDWRHGVLPWWNPYSGVGMPLAGEMQPAAFFLPFVLLLGLAHGVLYLKMTLQVGAGLAMWGLLLQLGLRGGIALTGGILLELCGTFAWASDPPILPLAFLPLLLLGIERARAAARLGQGGSWVLLACAIAYSLLAGFPEVAYIDGLLGSAWLALRLVQGRGHRGLLAAKAACGGIAGMLLAAPVLVAFASFLQQSHGGRDFNHQALPAGLYAQFLFPYIYGPFFFGGRVDWYLIDGYLGVPALLMAALGVLRGRDRGLCVLLGVWLVLGVAKAADLPVISSLWNLVPLVGQAMFLRYAWPSWEVAGIVLACIALQGLADRAAALLPAGSGRLLPAGSGRVVAADRRVLACAAACAGLCVAALVLGRPVWRELGSVPGGRSWFYAATGFGALTGLASLAALAVVPIRMAVPALASLLVLDAAVQFTVPLLSGTRGDARRIDMGVVTFLRQNLGLQRFYTLGPLGPNYGAYFGLASINHIYAPQPESWVGYIHDDLDPGANLTSFNGYEPPHPGPGETRLQAFERLEANFRAIGVKYLLLRSDRVASVARSLDPHPPYLAFPLEPGATVQGSFAAGDYGQGVVSDVAVLVGTYAGAASGVLRIELCAAASCASAEADLHGAADNAPLQARLGRALVLPADGRVSYTLTHVGGASAVALWLGRDPHGAQSAALPAGAAPELRLSVRPNVPAGRSVYEDDLADIFELSSPAAYFDAGSGCRLSYTDRDRVLATCIAPGRLIRRELMFDGWHAWVNGRRMRMTANGIFQQVELPAGESSVVFAFSPPYARLAFVMFAGGACMVAWQVSRGTQHRKQGLLF